MELNQLKCTECGGPLKIKPGTTEAFCTKCGSTYLVNDETLEKIKLSEAEATAHERMSEANTEAHERKSEADTEAHERKTAADAEYNERTYKAESKNTAVNGFFYTNKVYFLVPVLLLVLVAGFFVIKGIWNRIIPEPDPVVVVEIPFSSKEADKWTYDEAIVRFKDAGFTNIDTPIADEDMHWYTVWLKENEVSSITIGGDDDWKEGDEFNPEAQVRIYYHSKKN